MIKRLLRRAAVNASRYQAFGTMLNLANRIAVHPELRSPAETPYSKPLTVARAQKSMGQRETQYAAAKLNAPAQNDTRNRREANSMW